MFKYLGTETNAIEEEQIEGSTPTTEPVTITTAEEIELLNKNKKFISYEVTPQHLTLSSPSCYNKLGSLAQMNPAIRSNKHLNRLRKALKNNEIDIVGSDHAPHTLAEKKQEYPDSPSGMPGVQTLMPILLNEVSKKNISINNVVQLTSYNPIKRFKVKNKGLIKEGYDADFTFVDLTKTKKILERLHLTKMVTNYFQTVMYFQLDV